MDYKNEYLAWVVSFGILFMNNLSERSLRGAKAYERYNKSEPKMSQRYIIQSKTGKKGVVYWQLLDAKGRIIAQDTDKERALEPIKKLISKLETWPSSAKRLATEADMEKAARIASRRNSWESWNFAVAKWRGLLQTKDLAEHLGASEAWVRKNIAYIEWHHSYKQKGESGVAFFYDPDDVIKQLAQDEAKIKRLQRLSYNRYTELCELTGQQPVEPEDLGWYKKVQEHRQPHKTEK
ncbi:MAG: hypothetical protein PWQ93_49 [Clostridiales bacterium]|nr:hypothetical protein [Clostridiales bacterium]